MNNDLAYYKKNVTSQWGEDGIIEEIFRRIGMGGKFCIEIGAWNGKYLSNTWNLWHNEGWSALLIERDEERGKEAAENARGYENVKILSHSITVSGKNSFDPTVEKVAAGCQADLVSIDIDGDDYYIFRGIKKYLPRVMVIEYNPTIPPEFNVIQKENEYFGASALSLLHLAEEKGYRLAAMTETNCIFVLQSEFEKLHITQHTLADLFPKKHLTYIITSYGGVPFINQFPPYAKSNIPLPRKLPEFISTYSFIPIFPVRRNESFFHALKRLLKKFGVHLLYKKVRMSYQQFLNNKNFLRKKNTIDGYRARHSPVLFIETGTYKGDIVEAMRGKFKKIFSIELGKDLCGAAQNRFKADSHVEIICGDSTEVLPRIIEKINQPVLFWLDAHYSRGITARGNRDTPIWQELQTILSHPVKRHVVLIDDARCFNGTNDYPTIEEIRDLLVKRAPHYSIETKKDIVRIFPKNT